MWPVSRTHRKVQNSTGHGVKRVGAGAPVFVAAVTEFFAAEVLELAGNLCTAPEQQGGARKRLMPKDLLQAIRSDKEIVSNSARTMHMFLTPLTARYFPATEQVHGRHSRARGGQGAARRDRGGHRRDEEARRIKVMRTVHIPHVGGMGSPAQVARAVVCFDFVDVVNLKLVRSGGGTRTANHRAHNPVRGRV